MLQPSPAPRFSRTPATLSRRPPLPGEHTSEALLDWGFSAERIARLERAGAIGRDRAETAAATRGAA
jgi:alpha-methylacyl-CoA racemase